MNKEQLLVALKQFMGNENQEDNYFFDYELIGVSKYLKLISQASGDMELLGIATHLEQEAKKSIDEEMEAQFEYQEEMLMEMENDEAIKQLCIDLFYKQCLFCVPMAKYADMVSGLEGDCTGTNTLEFERLKKYIDEKNVLDKAYTKTKNNLQGERIRGKLKEVPSADRVKAEFEAVKQDIYRRADAHVPKQIDKIQRAVMN